MFKKSADFGEIKKRENLYRDLVSKMETCQKRLTPLPRELQVEAPKETKESKPVPQVNPQDENKNEEKKTEPNREQAAPVIEKKEKDEDTVLRELHSIAVRNLNEGIRYYFNGELSSSEDHLKEAIRVFSSVSLSLSSSGKPGKDRRNVQKKLISAYRFMAAALIEKYYLGLDTTGNALNEAKNYISKILLIDPAFKWDKEDKKYFSLKVTEFFRKAGNL